VLGTCGLNFGAGMTGGVSFVLDLTNTFVDCCNFELIEIQRLSPRFMGAYRNYVHDLIKEYVAETESVWGRTVVDKFSYYLHRFWLVKPKAAELKTLLNSLRQAA
jgi:glutamate synthase (NADPH/NADH) large chain